MTSNPKEGTFSIHFKITDMMGVMITGVNHRHSVLGARALCSRETREARARGGESVVLIPVSINSLTEPLLPSSCPKLPAPPWSPAAPSSPPGVAASLSISLAGFTTHNTLPHSVCLCFGARGREKSKMPLGFWLGHWGDDRAIP